MAKVQEELRREKEARVAAELKTNEAKNGYFEMQQKIDHLEAQATEYRTATTWRESRISTLKESLKKGQQEMVYLYERLHMPKDTAWQMACSATNDWELAKKLKEQDAAREAAAKNQKK